MLRSLCWKDRNDGRLLDDARRKSASAFLLSLKQYEALVVEHCTRKDGRNLPAESTLSRNERMSASIHFVVPFASLENSGE